MILKIYPTIYPIIPEIIPTVTISNPDLIKFIFVYNDLVHPTMNNTTIVMLLATKTAVEFSKKAKGSIGNNEPTKKDKNMVNAFFKGRSRRCSERPNFF